MTLVVWLLDQGMVMGNEPTHPPGFCKAHRYAKEWNGLLLRGCVAQKLSLKVNLAISKKCPTLIFWERIFLLTWSPYVMMRQHVWVLFSWAASDFQTIFVFEMLIHGCFYVTFHGHFWFVVIFCQMKWIHHTFFNQRELLESGGHGHWSLMQTDPHFAIDTTYLKLYNELFSEIMFSR